MAKEPESARRNREHSRELFDAAQRLALHDPLTSGGARALLHVEGALSALKVITGLEASSSTEILAAKPLLLSDAESQLLRSPPATATEELEALHRTLLDDAETRVRRVTELQQRSFKLRGAAVIGAATLIVIASWGMVALATPRNFARGKAWRASSVGLECKPKEHKCGNTRTDIFFHTHNEQDPWIEFDLETPTAFSALTVRNRMDMGVARAAPMVVEVTDDHQTWREVARRAETFSTWTPSFPTVTARYVRLRVLKKTWLHLEAVEVHP